MTAPWSVELQKNVLIFVDHVFVVVGDDDGYRTFLLLWDWLALDAGLDLAVYKVLYKVADFLLGELLALIKWELLVLDSLLDGKSGPLVDLKVEVAGVCAEGFGIDDSEIDFALVFLSNWLEGLG